MPNITIGERQVGNAYPCFIVAEACDNHLGNIEVAKNMVRLSKLAGADAIKFQHHLPDEEMLPDIPMSNNMTEPLYHFLKKYAFKIEHHIELKRLCDDVGIQYMCTPFSLKAAEELYYAGLLNVIKIGSGEMTDIPSIIKMASWKIPLIISTGMSTFQEINETYKAVLATQTPFALMNCTSAYPPLYADINLGVIKQMRDRYQHAVIGHSDHSPTLYTCFAAAALGAKIIEKHCIIDKTQKGPDQKVSINFLELSELVRGIRIIEEASGNEKKVHAQEQQVRYWAFRSIVTKRPLSKGEFISPESIWSKRPGTGIPAKRMPEIIGRQVVRDIPENTLLSWDDLA